MASKDINVSIVVPLFNEEKVMPMLIERLNKLGDSLPYKLEIVLVNDKAVMNYIEEEHGKLVKARRTPTTRKAPGAFDKGFETGKNVNINKGIDKQ